MSEDRELLHAWKQDDKSLRLYRDAGELVLSVFDDGDLHDEIAMSPATATSVGRMLVRKTVGK